MDTNATVNGNNAVTKEVITYGSIGRVNVLWKFPQNGFQYRTILNFDIACTCCKKRNVPCFVYETPISYSNGYFCINCLSEMLQMTICPPEVTRKAIMKRIADLEKELEREPINKANRKAEQNRQKELRKQWKQNQKEKLAETKKDLEMFEASLR